MNDALNNLSPEELQARVNAACAAAGHAATNAEVLAWACKRGRVLAGLETYQPRRIHKMKQGLKEFVREFVRECGGDKSRAAKRLGIARNTLYAYLDQTPEPVAEEKIIFLKQVAALVLCAILAAGCQSSSSVPPSETPPTALRKPISGVKPLAVAPFQKMPQAATAPPAQKFLTWDSAETRARVYVGPARNILTNSFLIAGKSFPIEPGLHYGVAAVDESGTESTIAYWPSNRIGVLIEQTSPDLSAW